MTAATPATAGATTHLQPMRWWDIEAVTELERVLFAGDSPWTAAMFWSELAAGHHYVTCHDQAGAIAGYAGLSVGAGEAEIRTIGVARHAQGQGIGRALLHDLLNAAGPLPVLLEVRCDNEPAIALYTSEGFARVGIRRRYYQPSGADAYTMRRKITSCGGNAPDSDANTPQQTIIREAP